MDIAMDQDSTTSLPKILLIDDEPIMHDLVREALSGCCIVVAVISGEDALTACTDWQPDLLLIDVSLPGMDGYETCRQLKALEQTAATPAIFLSSHDQIEDRLRGYEAGAGDYLTKPFHLDELRAKVQQLLSMVSSQNELQAQAAFASSTAMTVMTNMGELGALLEVLKQFNACNNREQLLETALKGLESFALRGVVQTRMPEGKLTHSSEGAATPLEESVMQHMVGMERIVQFKSRMSINYEHVSILISNLPVDDPDRCGRLRDHLAMLVEAAEVRAESIISAQRSQIQGQAIEQTLSQIAETLSDIDTYQRQMHVNTRLLADEVTHTFDHALLEVALSEAQENFLANTFRSSIDRIVHTISAEIGIQDKLSAIVKKLGQLDRD